MKIPRTLISFAFLLALAVSCAAQAPQPAPTPEEFQTRLESLMSETGAVIVKGYTRVGSMTGSRGVANVTAWETTNALTGRTEQGVSIVIGDSTRPEAEERAFIDYDELAPLLKGIDYIMRLDNRVTKLSRYEAQYQTRGGLVLMTFNAPSGPATAISTEGGRRARFVMRQAGLAEFRNLLESAKEALDAPKSQ